MPALTVSNPVYENKTGIVGGQTYRIDLKHRPFAIDSFQIRLYFSFSCAAPVTIKAFPSLIFGKEIRLSGSRAGGTDMMKQLTANHLARLNAYDHAVSKPLYFDPQANSMFPTVLGPGTYNCGFNLRLNSAPYRMNYAFSNLFLIPAPLYSTLTLEIDTENFASLFTAGAPTFLAGSGGLEVEEIDVPSIDCLRTPFGSFQEMYSRDTITAQNSAGYEIRPPRGNYLYQIAQHCYNQADNSPQDLLIDKVELRENVSTIRSETWNRLRERNQYDFNLSLLDMSYGFNIHRFAEQGREDALLNTTDYGTQGRDLIVKDYIPTLPAGFTKAYIDTISRIIVPRINA